MELNNRKFFQSLVACNACPDKDKDKSCPCDPYESPPKEHAKTPTYLIIIFSFVATIFIVLCCYAFYVKFIRPRRRTTTPSQPPSQREQDLFDEEQQQVDHPIWYIRTTGLQQSLISAITVCKYRKDEGLIEGTECSVCLSEFQEEESLRLLPKCNHAFHLPCIDTWLGSHTNCPMCRAPIVTDPTRVPSMDPRAFASSSFVEVDVLESGMENTHQSSADLLRNQEEEGVEEVGVLETSENSASGDVTVQPRRSVSLDSSSAAKIGLALATVTSGESHGNSSKRVAKGAASSSSSSSSTSSVKRSRSFNAKHLVSWYGRSQRKTNPNAPLRSF
ncbi:hypothetical protein Fmac_005108 [Flemingia macrophylla]|uniref:RING-type E3 ubiquitin transferase n=1 Tax=Flemingia macrophylla TaxID=520843 RepID=A0ABD1N769_9FABA